MKMPYHGVGEPGAHLRDFFGISGLERPRDPCKGQAGSQSTPFFCVCVLDAAQVKGTSTKKDFYADVTLYGSYRLPLSVQGENIWGRGKRGSQRTVWSIEHLWPSRSSGERTQ